ncbi:MAG: hypothetical protein CL624_04545 [Arcobacter sp.]|nr:hypothetical protein [Arcobacter sp.]|tara:strand:+ start:20471 stop:20674 length:204 start_codon:yes stop_codon:yes gene_type:complete
MNIYTCSSIVEIGDIKIIDNELKKLGSKVEKSLLNNENIVYLIFYILYIMIIKHHYQKSIILKVQIF